MEKEILSFGGVFFKCDQKAFPERLQNAFGIKTDQSPTYVCSSIRRIVEVTKEPIRTWLLKGEEVLLQSLPADVCKCTIVRKEETTEAEESKLSFYIVVDNDKNFYFTLQLRSSNYFTFQIVPTYELFSLSYLYTLKEGDYVFDNSLSWPCAYFLKIHILQIRTWIHNFHSSIWEEISLVSIL